MWYAYDVPANIPHVHTHNATDCVILAVICGMRMLFRPTLHMRTCTMPLTASYLQLYVVYMWYAYVVPANFTHVHTRNATVCKRSRATHLTQHV